jgi:excisionase family DNA binding protein
MGSEPGDVLTIEELSVYLKIPKSTLYKLVREGMVPCRKIGRHWRFQRNAIDAWLQEHRGPDVGKNENSTEESANREQPKT